MVVDERHSRLKLRGGAAEFFQNFCVVILKCVMGSKRTRTGKSGASSSKPPTPASKSNYEKERFVSLKEQKRYFELQKRAFIMDRGIEYDGNPTPNSPLFETMRQKIPTRQWEKFVNVPERINQTLALEFLANLPEEENARVRVRKTNVLLNIDAIHRLFGLEMVNSAYYKRFLKLTIDPVDLAETVGFLGLRLHEVDKEPQMLYRCELNQVARAWMFFVSVRLMPSKHLSDFPLDILSVVYAIMKGITVPVGGIILESLDNMVAGSTHAGIGFAGLITELCIANGVPQYPYDNQVQPQRNIDWTMVRNLKPPHPYGQPPPPRCNQQQEAHVPEEEDNPNEEMPQAVPTPTPLDARMHHIHAQINYIIQQNNHIQSYMVQRSEFDENQVRQFNHLIDSWNLAVEDPNYLAYPPRFHSYDQPLPPNPF
ncbi:hypothetical protein CsatB_014677 [Cannabis sativa]